MNSKKAGGKPYSATAGGVGTSFRKSVNFEASSSVSCYPNPEELSSDMGDLNTDPIQNGEWEVIGKKKNKVGYMTGKQWSSNASPKTSIQPGTGRSSGTKGTLKAAGIFEEETCRAFPSKEVPYRNYNFVQI